MTGILLTMPFQGADLQPTVFLHPFYIQRNGNLHFFNASGKIILFTNEDPIQIADGGDDGFGVHLTKHDRDDAFVIFGGMLNFHLAHLRIDRIRTDEENERV